jgi:hypothetical protein
MADQYESSSSIPEKLTLLVFITAIVIGNVSFMCMSTLSISSFTKFRVASLLRILFVVKEDIGQMSLS